MNKKYIFVTGGVVSVFVVFLAINIIVNGTKQLKKYKEDNFNGEC